MKSQTMLSYVVEHDDIIQVAHEALPKKSIQVPLHEALERSRGVAQPKGHYYEL